MEIDQNTLIGIIVSAVIAILMFMLGINTGKPKLIVNGGGGGSPDSVHHTNVGIQNDPSFLGMRLDRQQAKINHAILKDKRTKEIYHLPCNWRTSGVPELTREVTLSAGERKDIVLFLQRRGSEQYFVCGGKQDQIPEKPQVFTERENEFTLSIQDAVGRKYDFDFIVRNRNSNLQVSSAITFAQRLRMIRESGQILLRALKPGKFH